MLATGYFSGYFLAYIVRFSPSNICLPNATSDKYLNFGIKTLRLHIREADIAELNAWRRSVAKRQCSFYSRRKRTNADPFHATFPNYSLFTLRTRLRVKTQRL